MNTNYVDVPVVEITATGGGGYVNVSWTVIGNNEACMVRSYTVTLLSFAMEELDKKLTSSTQHVFSNLLYDTVFYVTIFSHNAHLGIGDIDIIPVRTKDLEGTFIQYVCKSFSMYILNYMCMFYIIIQNVATYVHV